MIAPSRGTCPPCSGRRRIRDLRPLKPALGVAFDGTIFVSPQEESNNEVGNQPHDGGNDQSPATGAWLRTVQSQQQRSPNLRVPPSSNQGCVRGWGDKNAQMCAPDPKRTRDPCPGGRTSTGRDEMHLSRFGHHFVDHACC